MLVMVLMKVYMAKVTVVVVFIEIYMQTDDGNIGKDDGVTVVCLEIHIP